MTPDNLRAVFARPSTQSPSGWTVKRMLSWVARGATVLLLLLCGIVWLEGRQFAQRADSIATNVLASAGELPSSEETDRAFADLDQRIAEIKRRSEEARAQVAVAQGEIPTVADWRAASPTEQVVRAEHWLRAAVRDGGQAISDATFRMVASEIAACVNASIRSAAGIEDIPAAVFGARCIAGLSG